MTKKLLLALMITFAACNDRSDVLSPDAPAADLIHNGVAYPQVDQQVNRLYHFNNCLTAVTNSTYTAAECGLSEVTYQIASRANQNLAEIFIDGLLTDGPTALAAIDKYISVIEQGYGAKHVTCRARFALLGVAGTVKAVITQILNGQPVDLSGFPQPLEASLVSLNLMANATDPNGLACGTETLGPVFANAGGYSIFASNEDCVLEPAVEINGHRNAFLDRVHANSAIAITGDDFEAADDVTYRCGSSISGSNQTFSGLTQVSTVRPLPAVYMWEDYPCTYSVQGTFNVGSDGPWWVNGTSASRKLRPGVYCADGGDLLLTTDGASGLVTFKATGQIIISGTNVILRAHQAEILMFSQALGIASGTAVSVTGNGAYLGGTIYAPGRTVNLLADGVSVNGSVLAGRFRLIGSDAVMFTRR